VLPGERRGLGFVLDSSGVGFNERSFIRAVINCNALVSITRPSCSEELTELTDIALHIRREIVDALEVYGGGYALLVASTMLADRMY